MSIKHYQVISQPKYWLEILKKKNLLLHLSEKK